MIGKKQRLPLSVFILTFILLAFIQLKVERPMLLAERFLKGGGWAEIFLISLYGAFVAYKMQDPMNVPNWCKTERNLYLILTISLHASCISLARI
jgi:hypothetical protein